ncbi:class I SAM-dependent methyltransferase [Deltaproteobacteria bacterium TL4]
MKKTYVPTSEQTSQFYDNLLEGKEKRGMFGKDQRFNAMRVYSRPSTRKYFVDVVRPYVQESDRILDFGCGSGAFLCSIASFCREIVGVDISQKFVEETQTAIQMCELKNAKSMHIPVNTLPFEDKSFDVLMMIDVIHHLENIHQTLTEAFRVLKDDGKIIIYEPNKLNPLLYFLHYIDPNERGLLKLGSPFQYRKVLSSYMKIQEISFNGIVIGPESSLFTLMSEILNYPPLKPILGWLNPKMFIGGTKK